MLAGYQVHDVKCIRDIKCKKCLEWDKECLERDKERLEWDKTNALKRIIYAYYWSTDINPCQIDPMRSLWVLQDTLFY